MQKVQDSNHGPDNNCSLKILKIKVSYVISHDIQHLGIFLNTKILGVYRYKRSITPKFKSWKCNFGDQF